MVAAVRARRSLGHSIWGYAHGANHVDGENCENQQANIAVREPYHSCVDMLCALVIVHTRDVVGTQSLVYIFNKADLLNQKLFWKKSHEFQYHVDTSQYTGDAFG